MIRMIATDMDGTLLDSTRHILPRTKQALCKAREQGCEVVIATGRPIEGILPYAKELGTLVPGQYAIAFNGAAVYELSTLKTVVQDTISNADIRKLAACASSLGLYSHAFSMTRGLLTEKNNEWTDIEKNYNQIPLTLTDFQACADHEEFFKILFCGPQELIDKAEEATRDLRQNFTVVRSMPFFLEFLNKNASKGFALEKLASYLGIPLTEVMAFGDAQNDEHMLEVAGVGVAMGNSVPLIIDMADKVTASNDEDGIAIVVEQELGLS